VCQKKIDEHFVDGQFKHHKANSFCNSDLSQASTETMDHLVAMTTLEMMEKLKKDNRAMYWETHDDMVLLGSGKTFDEVKIDEGNSEVIKAAQDASRKGSQVAKEALYLRQLLLIWKAKKVDAEEAAAARAATPAVDSIAGAVARIVAAVAARVAAPAPARAAVPAPARAAVPAPARAAAPAPARAAVPAPARAAVPAPARAAVPAPARAAVPAPARAAVPAPARAAVPAPARAAKLAPGKRLGGFAFANVWPALHKGAIMSTVKHAIVQCDGYLAVPVYYYAGNENVFYKITANYDNDARRVIPASIPTGRLERLDEKSVYDIPA
jgi:hypothetical protein